MYKYAMNFVTIEMKEIFSYETNEEKYDFILEHIRNSIAEKEKNGYLNYYPFNNEWIDFQRFNWEQNINLATNRKFDQICILN
jgi:hypothetical protein